MCNLKALRVRDAIPIPIPLSPQPKPTSARTRISTKSTPYRARDIPALSGMYVVRVVLVRCWGARSAHDFGECVHENDAEGGHAGAHYADVYFDGGPVAYVDLVPSGVG